MTSIARRIQGIIVVLALALAAAAQPEDQPEQSGPPPAIVVVESVGETILAPDGEFLGTLYYNVDSDIASEVQGLVNEIFIEAGQRVKQGDILVHLQDDLLKQDLIIAEASLAELETALEKARTDLRRSEKLFAEQSVSEQVYDDDRFAVQTRERLVQLQTARINKIKTELGKKEIRAPFDGAILAKHTDVGEWIDQGGRIATIARVDEIDLIANVPQNIVALLNPGQDVLVTINRQPLTGRIFAIVPRGDIATRTFPVRIRLVNPGGAYFEGMEGYVRLPVGPETACLEVPRDAVLRQPQGSIVYTAENGAAALHPVEIVGYTSATAGVRSPTLQAGMQVITKGNERLFPGQPVNPRDGIESPSSASPESAPAATTQAEEKEF